MNSSLLLFHRTVGPEYDDRIQKIFGSIVREGAGVPSVAISAKAILRPIFVFKLC